MDINSRFSQAAVIAAGIAFLGMCIKSGIDDFVNKDRVVTVKGLSEKEVESYKGTRQRPHTTLPQHQRDYQQGEDIPETKRSKGRRNKRQRTCGD